MGVGVGAVGFHASSGKARHWGRKLDYWVISHPRMAHTRTYLAWAYKSIACLSGHLPVISAHFCYLYQNSR